MTNTLPRRAVILFDGQCPFCLKSVALLKRLDWLKRFDYRNARQQENWPADAKTPLVMDKLTEEMHLVTPDGDVSAGFGAFRQIFAQLPMTWGLVPLTYVPGVTALGNRLYRWVARNRFDLVPCHDGVCALPRK